MFDYRRVLGYWVLGRVVNLQQFLVSRGPSPTNLTWWVLRWLSSIYDSWCADLEMFGDCLWIWGFGGLKAEMVNHVTDDAGSKICTCKGNRKDLDWIVVSQGHRKARCTPLKFDPLRQENPFMQLHNPGFFNQNPLEVLTVGIFFSLFDFQLGLLKSNRKTIVDFIGFRTLLIKTPKPNWFIIRVLDNWFPVYIYIYIYVYIYINTYEYQIIFEYI